MSKREPCLTLTLDSRCQKLQYFNITYAKKQQNEKISLREIIHINEVVALATFASEKRSNQWINPHKNYYTLNFDKHFFIFELVSF